MEYHKGKIWKIWIESAGDDGSIFHVSLPKLKHAQEKQLSLPNS